MNIVLHENLKAKDLSFYIHSLPKSSKFYDFDEKYLDADAERVITLLFGEQIAEQIGIMTKHYVDAAYLIKRNKIEECNHEYQQGERMLRELQGDALGVGKLMTSTSRALRSYKNKDYELAANSIYEAIEIAEKFEKLHLSYFFHVHKIQLFFYLSKVYLRDSYLPKGAEIISKILNYLYLGINPENDDSWGSVYLSKIPDNMIHRLKILIFLDAINYKMLFSNLYAYSEETFYNAVFSSLTAMPTDTSEEVIFFKKWLEAKEKLFKETPDMFDSAISFLQIDTFQEFDPLKISIVKTILDKAQKIDSQNFEILKAAFRSYAEDKLWVPLNAKIFLTV